MYWPIYLQFKKEYPNMPEAIYHNPGIRSIWKIVNNLIPTENLCDRCLRDKCQHNHVCASIEDYLMKLGGFRCQIGCDIVCEQRQKIIEHLLTHTNAELLRWFLSR